MTRINQKISTNPHVAPIDPLPDTLGVVVIGRNEGERLRLALHSVLGKGYPVVYVDSGSTDGSVALAHSLGVDVVELDATRPFTAARARNAGLARLLECSPGLEFVQFVDGDCEMIEGWFEVGLQAMEDRPDAVAVFGRVRERHPDASVYNRLCDMEWDGPIGEVAECGGVALMRVTAVYAVGGFDSKLIAGEEPELCRRMRLHGGRIVRLVAVMTLHDAAIYKFSQWWRRSVRGGVAYAEAAWRFGTAPDRYCVRNVASVIVWAAFVPLLAIATTFAFGFAGMLPLALYLVLFGRVFWCDLRKHRSMGHATLQAGFIVIGKFAQCIGIVSAVWSRIMRHPVGLIEHKLQ